MEISIISKKFSMPEKEQPEMPDLDGYGADDDLDLDLEGVATGPELEDSDQIPVKIESRRLNGFSRLGTDPMSVYLAEIGKIPLIDKEREAVLARKIDISKRAFFRMALSSAYAASRIASKIEAILDGREPFESLFISRHTERIFRADTLSKAVENLAAVKPMLNAVSKLRNRRPTTSRGIRRRRICSKGRLFRAGALLAELGLRVEVIVAEFERLALINEVMRQIGKKGGIAATKDLRRNLGLPATKKETEDLLGETAKEFERRVGTARRRLALLENAKEEFVRSNLRLVVSIARKYEKRGMSLADLIQEGNTGLMSAIDKFDYTRGFKFSTFATWWIRQAILRAIADQAKTVRVPIHIIENIGRLKKAIKEISYKTGRRPDMQELARHMGSSEDEVRAIFKVIRQSRAPVSLSRPVGDGDGCRLGDFLEDMTSDGPLRSTSLYLLREKLLKLLTVLPDRERDILMLRYGLDSGNSLTLDEIASRFRLSRERVRQIEAKALQRLRVPEKVKDLESY